MSGSFVKKYGLSSASSVQSALKGLMEKDLITHTEKGYRVYDFFFADRLSLLLNANDIFNWNKENNYITNPAYQSYTSSKVNSRYVSLEVIFKIL